MLQICVLRDMLDESQLLSLAEEMGSHMQMNLSRRISGFTEGFLAMYQSQSIRDFLGLRDFFAFVKQLSKLDNPNNSDILRHLQRNFNGLPSGESTEIQRKFTSLVLPTGANIVRFSSLELIQGNLREKMSRHLLLISANQVAKFILRESDIVSNSVTMEGGHFPGDRGPHLIHYHLRQLRTYMKEGRVVIFVNMHHIYEALYEVLNRREIKMGTSLYSRIAVGYERETCPIHPNFKIIVIVSPEESYSLPPPFLNRFEKHTLDWKDTLSSSAQELTQQLQGWIQELCRISPQLSPSFLFLGFHNSFLHSLANTITETEKDFKEAFERAKESILWLLKPEGLALFLSHQNNSTVAAVVHLYTQKILKSTNSLVDFLRTLKEQNSNPFIRRKNFSQGYRFVIYSYSGGFNLHMIEKAQLLNPKTTTTLNLAEFTTEREFVDQLSDFWSHSNTTLIVECSLSSWISHQLVNYAFYLCDQQEEKCHMKSEAVQPRNVFFIVYCQQRKARDSITVDFNGFWNSLVIDTLENTSLSITEMLSAKSWTEMISDPVEYVKPMISSAISKLAFLETGDAEEQQMISQLIPRVRECLHNEDIAKIIRENLRKLLVKIKDSNNDSWVLDCCHKSFVGSLHSALLFTLQQKMSLLFAWYLSTLLRNGNLSLLSHPMALPLMESLPWIPDVIRERSPFHVRIAFPARFPFSFSLVPNVQRIAENAPNLQKGKTLHSTLESLFNAFHPMKLDEQSMNNYCFDLAHLVDTSSVNRNLLWRFLQWRMSKEKWTHLADVETCLIESSNFLFSLSTLIESTSSRTEEILFAALEEAETINGLITTVVEKFVNEIYEEFQEGNFLEWAISSGPLLTQLEWLLPLNNSDNKVAGE